MERGATARLVASLRLLRSRASSISDRGRAHRARLEPLPRGQSPFGQIEQVARRSVRGPVPDRVGRGAPGISNNSR